MTKTLNIKEMATELVGDGKKPNKWFLTIGYGWYFPKPLEVEAELPDMVQVENSIESVTIVFTDQDQALQAFENIHLNMPKNNEVTTETIGQVTLEDRRNGVIKEKCLTMRHNGTFGILRS